MKVVSAYILTDFSCCSVSCCLWTAVSCALLEHCSFIFVLELVSLRLVCITSKSRSFSLVGFLCLLLDCEFVRCRSLGFAFAFAFVSWFSWLTSCLVVCWKSFSRSRYLLLSLLHFVNFLNKNDKQCSSTRSTQKVFVI